MQKARKSLIHQQPGGLAGQLSGRAPPQSLALPPTALAGPLLPSAQHQGGSKRAQQADVHSKLKPGSATAAAGHVGSDDSIGTGVAVTNSRMQSGSAEVQQAGGMSWNPVRLSSPFEKATEPTGSQLDAHASCALQPLWGNPPPPPPTPPHTRQTPNTHYPICDRSSFCNFDTNASGSLAMLLQTVLQTAQCCKQQTASCCRQCCKQQTY